MPAEPPVARNGAGRRDMAGRAEPHTPASLRWGVWLLIGEAAVLTAVLVFLVYADVTTPTGTARGPLAVTLYAALMAALFAFLAWALRRRRAWARGPAIVLNMLLLPIGYSMLTAGLGWLGIPVMLAGLGGAGTLLAPATRAALGSR
jgi:hypothetical protein